MHSLLLTYAPKPMNQPYYQYAIVYREKHDTKLIWLQSWRAKLVKQRGRKTQRFEIRVMNNMRWYNPTKEGRKRYVDEIVDYIIKE